MSPVKILLISDYGRPAGGVEINLGHIRKGLRERGHEVCLFTSRAGVEGSATIADCDCLGTLSSFRSLLQTANPWAACALAKILRDFQPDVVHLGMFLTQLSPLVLRPLRFVPTLFHVTCYRSICPLGTKYRPDGTHCRELWGPVCRRNHCLSMLDSWVLAAQQRLLHAWRGQTIRQMVAVSEAVRQRLLADGFGDARVIFNGVPTRPARPPLTGPPLVVFCGRLVPEKGLPVLLDAFFQVVGKLPEARLVIIGDGPERASVAARVGALGLTKQVEMTGHLDTKQLERCCDAAWVQVVSSQWEEPFGLVAAEAMMRGTAVITSRLAGLAEQIEDGVTGYTVTPFAVDGWVTAMLLLLGDRDHAETLGAAGRERALREYTMELFLDRLVTLYEAVAASPP